ncbi:MAG: hypothetical protein AMXMBFR20_08590 [Planctomycetia bacterium]
MAAQTHRPLSAKELKGFIDRDSIQPGSEARFAVELAHPAKCLQVGLLREIERDILTLGHSQTQPVNAIRSLAVELMLGIAIPIAAAFDQF